MVHHFGIFVNFYIYFHVFIVFFHLFIEFVTVSVGFTVFTFIILVIFLLRMM